MTPTAGTLIDEFLAHRARAVTARTLARDRRALEALREYLDRDGPMLLDEFTGRRLARAGGGIGLCDLVDVEAIIMNARGFLTEGLPEPDRPAAAKVLRLFVLWLQRRGDLDRCSALSLQSLCAEHAPTRPRWSGPPGRRRSW